MAQHDPDLTRLFLALADPTRRAILTELGQGARPVTALARPTGLALPTVMKHLACLEAAQLVSSEKQGRQRMCRLTPAPLAGAADWLARRATAWADQADRLERHALSLLPPDDDRKETSP